MRPNAQESVVDIEFSTVPPRGADAAPAAPIATPPEGAEPNQPAAQTAVNASQTSALHPLDLPTASAWAFEVPLPLLGKVPAAARHPWRPAPEVGVPDIAIDAVQVGPLQLRAASTRGLEHRLHATVRQDSHGVSASADNSWALAAVADGLGSAAASHVASRTVVDAALEHLRVGLTGDAQPWSVVAAGAINSACSRLAEAASFRHEARDLLTTLVLAAVQVTASEDGRRRVLLARVGDSTALLIQAGILTDAFGGAAGRPEVHTTRTACLPLNPEALETKEYDLADGEAVVLASDGFYGPALSEPARSYLLASWREAPPVDRLLADMHLLARTHDDDRTVAGCWVPAKETS